MKDKKTSKPELFIDNEKYQWDKETITGSEIRSLASLPDDVEIYQHIPGQPDKLINNNTIVDLTEHQRPERFSTQSPGSQAG